MVNKPKTSASIVSHEAFKLAPLSASIRMAIAGGMFMGSVASTVNADSADAAIAAAQAAATADVTSSITAAQSDAAATAAAAVGTAGLSPGLAPLPEANDAATAAVTVQNADGTKTDVNIQDRDNAILNWKSFNIGTGHEVEFHQKSSDSIALNRIFQENPSEILGKLTANGQIYLYNQNGFLFGQEAVVNTSSFVVSSLNITDEVLTEGITKQTDTDSSNPALGNDNSDPATAAKADAKIKIEKGAKIKVGDDGLVLMASSKVQNSGSISTGNFGQVILVASQDKVYLQPVSSDSQFNGLLVEVDTGGKVSNLGDILVKQGNITLAGFAVKQDGKLTATTSIKENGSIRLLAREQHGFTGSQLVANKTDRSEALDDGLGTSSSVELGSGSVTQIIADESGGTAIDAQEQPQSRIDIVADQIVFKGKDDTHAGASIVAPGANVNIIATKTPDVINSITGKLNSYATDTSSKKSRVTLEEGASIDVSGKTGVKVAMERNVAEISVQSYDLRDSPVQKSGILKGQTIKVDLRQDNEILDTSGAEARIQRSLDERLSEGGTVNIETGGEVVVNEGAVIDISGGSIEYQDGYINTTKLIDKNGQLTDIGNADPDQTYTSIYGTVTETHSKWGVTETFHTSAFFTKGRFEKGYVEGKDAGELNIKSPLMSWSGELVAGTEVGTYQRTDDKAPFGGSFTFNENVGDNLYSAQNIIFQEIAAATTVATTEAFPTTDGKPNDIIFSEDFVNRSGVENIVIKTRGHAKIAADADLAPDFKNHSGGLLEIDAANIDVQGNIYLPGGDIKLTSTAYANDADSGTITVAENSVLDVSGRWVNDYQKGFDTAPTEPLTIDAGSITLSAQGDVNLNTGSQLKANGGAWYSLDQELTAGKGGEISLSSTTSEFDQNARLHLDGQLSAQGIEQGGKLTLNSPDILVSGKQHPVADSTLLLTVTDGNFDVAKNGGFSEINLAEAGELVIKSDTHLKPIQQNNVLQTGFAAQASGASLDAFSNLEILPDQNRNAVDLSFSGGAGVSMRTGSTILADNRANITLSSTSTKGVYVDGTIKTSGGNITLQIIGDPAQTYDARQSIWLGSHAKLLARGKTLYDLPDALGRRSGEVLDGGNITLTANRGYVIQEQGALIDVSGSHGVIDLPVANKAGTAVDRYQATDVGSDAGKISIAAAQGIILDGDLKGFAGSETNKNGRLDFSVGENIVDNADRDAFPGAFPEKEATLNVTENKAQLLDENLEYGDLLDNFKNNPDSINKESSLNGKATISSQQVREGGFDDLRLASSGQIRFIGDVDLATRSRIDLSAKTIGWKAETGSSAKTGDVNIDTAYLKIGDELSRSNTTALTKGKGVFTAHANSVDLVGATVWNGFDTININSDHDLRLVGFDNQIDKDHPGSMATAADINLSSSQIYPSTLTQFTIKVDSTLNPDGAITITGKDTDTSPLAANGVLNVEAPIINQNGVLKAAFGTINLTASTSLTLGENSVTSVSGDGLLIPFGRTLGGVAWIYPYLEPSSVVYNNSSSSTQIQTKQINLKSPSIKQQKGSVVDISGGGDLLAYEFQSGIGGTYDYLDTTSSSYNGGFAIVPSQSSAMNVSDPLQNKAVDQLSSDQQSLYEVGSTVYLSGNDQLAAGYYTIMPARYALLPGAFLVTPQANSTDTVVNTKTTDGLTIMSGYYANTATGTRDSRTTGFLIENGDQIRSHSTYDENTASEFFTQKAISDGVDTPLIPKDSGQLYLEAQNQLLLEGSINSAAADGGRGAKVDISSNKIVVVSELSGSNANGLEIKADDLKNLNLDSLLLGGKRSRNNTTGETDIAVNTDSVTVENGVNLKVKDLVLAGKSKVEVKEGASIVVSDKVNTGDTQLNVTGNGALLRVSGDQQVTLNRTSITGTKGDLILASGSTISGEGSALQSVLLDASHSIDLSGDIQMQQGSLSLNANGISIGEVSALTDNSLKLTNSQLANINVDELLLNSRSTINFYGNVGQVADDGSLSALAFNNLTLSGAGVNGFENAGKAVKIQADSLTVQNTLTATSTSSGTGSGTFDISAKQYTQGAGNFAVTGFNTVNIKGQNADAGGLAFVADGKSKLTVAGDLNVTADYLTATGGSVFAIDATGHQANFERAASAKAFTTNVYGAEISVVADSVNFNTFAELPSGKLTLQALQGDVTVGANATLDLAGRAVQFADAIQYTSGGTLSAQADQGSVHLLAGSAVDLSSGGGGTRGGKLVLKAANGSVELAGQLKATGGSAQIDQKTFFGSQNFDSMMATLASAGVSDSIYFRSREADIIQSAGKQVNASSISLVSDKGSIDLSGTLNASGTKGGTIQLYAGDNIKLRDGSALLAKGSSGKGGKVLLSTVDNDADGMGRISVMGGSKIDVGGATAAKGGQVELRALRNGTGINIDPIAGTVTGYNHFYADAVQKYGNADISNGEITADVINTIKNDTDSYMSTAEVDLGSGIVLRPGVEIDYDGNLSLKEKWDLIDWKYNGEAGSLVIRSSGAFNIERPLTDGFAYSSLYGLETVTAGESWTYQLSAGADLQSADSVATIKADASTLAAGNADLKIGNKERANSILRDVYVRTGTGDITLAAGGNIILTRQFSTVYTAGRQDSSNPYGSLTDDIVAGYIPVEYPIDGGDLTLNSDNDIIGANSNQVISSTSFRTWLKQLAGGVSASGEKLASAWGIDFTDASGFQNFQENVGSFGGGNVTVNAAGNVSDLSVIMPTTGKQVGELSGSYDPDTGLPLFTTNELEINGGGEMLVNAGGDIAGGVYLLGKGQGTLNAGGAITGGEQFTAAGNVFQYAVGPQLIMGDSQFSLNANRGLGVNAVTDAFIAAPASQYFSYSESSKLSVSSLSGDIKLDNNTEALSFFNGVSESLLSLTKIYPASLEATAFGGSLLLSDITLFPSATSTLDVFAKDNIKGISTSVLGGISLLDSDPSLLPTVTAPYQSQNLEEILSQFALTTLTSTAQNILPILHLNDTQSARVVTQEGDIDGTRFLIAKKAIIQAGRDIKNATISVQNNNANDSSVVAAGRDIIVTTTVNDAGLLSVGRAGNLGIRVSGAGELLVKSGRNIDLGASWGIRSVGNQIKADLPDTGANLNIVAGLNSGAADYIGFVDYLSDPANNLKFELYKDELTEVKSLITSYMRIYLSDDSLSEEAALAAFRTLKPDDYLAIEPQLNAVLGSVLYSEINIAGSASALDKAAGNAGAYDAIEAFFPGTDWKGDLSLVFSTIQTTRGGDINLMVPGGSINAGLPFAFPGLVKASSELGIITQAAGSINAMVNDNIEVNQSRIFTQGGGDILLWSSEGDIDAGRGAKSALSVPELVVEYKNDRRVTTIRPAVSGSGIRTANSEGVDSDGNPKKAGNAALFAPKGVIDAGEAGIGAENVTISATAVRGANNIDIGGVGSGVPVAPTSIAAALTGVSNIGANVSQVAQASADMSEDTKSKPKNVALGVLSVDVLVSADCKSETGCKN
ncbi:hypothetical protein JCM14076_27430 [Methylosoma difficile]